MELKGKTVVVTGGAGFIGTHLCERLVREGNTVISLDNYFAGSPENHVSGVQYIEGHTKDIDRLITANPDIVYHLGEYSRVEKSFEDVEHVWDLNKIGTFAVLEFCRARGAKLIYAGSSTKFSDSGLGRDQSPYAWAKATNTELVRNYGEWFGLEYAVTYFYNVFGGRERGTGPYATLIGIYKEEYRKGNPLTVVLPGTQQRNFTHVDDIVEGLILVGEKGEGDNFGIGNPTSYTIMDVAKMFGVSVITLPERKGNRMSSSVDAEKTIALGWRAKKSLTDDIEEFLRSAKRGDVREERILVFSTTFHPTMGPAEHALVELMNSMSSVQFDIISARLDVSLPKEERFGNNATIYRVGSGSSMDKYLLPVLSKHKALELGQKHRYLFLWSLMASYAALAGVFSKRVIDLPLLVTLADQQIAKIPLHVRMVLKFILRKADQVYVSSKEQESHARALGRSTQYSRSIGQGDALANQIRFAYSTYLRNFKKQEQGITK